MHVAIIGGGGTVGATVGYSLATADPRIDVTLIDVDEDAARGHAIDARHATAHVSHSVGRAVLDSPESPGTVRAAGTDEGIDAPDMFVVTASAPRPDDAARRGGRAEFLDANLAVADDVAAQLRRFEPAPVLVVTNPLDRIAYRIWRESGWPRERVLGYSLSETARTADAIARLRGCRHADVHCPVMGEHGEHVVPVFSRATVGGEPAALDADERAEVRDYVRDVPYDVIALRGEADTSRWVTGWGAALVVRSVLGGGVDGPVCLSTPLDGEYGFEDACLGVPVTLTGRGVGGIVEWDLSDEEREGMAAAYESFRADLEQPS